MLGSLGLVQLRLRLISLVLGSSGLVQLRLRHVSIFYSLKVPLDKK